MLRAIRNTCLSLSMGLITAGLVSTSLAVPLIPVTTLIGSGLAAGAVGLALEVIAGGRRL